MNNLNSRQEQIVQYLVETHFAKVESLVEVFGVSNETIRRDLKKLEQESFIIRTHGGAQYDNLRAREKQYEIRAQRNFAEKKSIARLAASYVKDGDSIVLNTGTSTLLLAKELGNRNNLIVITNSLDAANILVENESNEVCLVGGFLRKSGRGLSGDISCEVLSKFQADKVFLSIGGIAEKCGVTEYHVSESAVMRKMIEISNKVMVLSDYSKFNEIALNRVCAYKDIDYLFTDWNTPMKEIVACKNAQIKVLVAQREEAWNLCGKPQ